MIVVIKCAAVNNNNNDNLICIAPVCAKKTSVWQVWHTVKPIGQ